MQAIPDGCKLTITASKLLGYVLIQLEDAGVGIPEENLAQFFQPLFEVERLRIRITSLQTNRG